MAVRSTWKSWGWMNKGDIERGRGISIAARKASYAPNEEVRVVHVVEVVAPGQRVYVMGPKPVQGEQVDGRLATPPAPVDGDPLVPGDYDGATLPSPAVDYNYDVTSYRFAERGVHRIRWQLGTLQSNELEIAIE